jgi:MFS transporter, AAHS family, 4-hydroxybenzoate transporter
VFVFAVIMADGFDLQMIGYVAPEIARSWSLPMAAFGPALGAALAGSIAGALLAGPTTRRIGPRATLELALTLFGALTLATSQAQHISTLIVLRLLAGVGLGAAVPVAVSVAADHSAARFRASLLTLALIGQPLGAIAGGALCAHYIPIYGWPCAFYLGGVLPLLLTAAGLGLLRDDAPGNGARVERGRFRELFHAEHRAGTLLMPACVFLATFFLYIIINWMPGILRSTGYSLQQSVLAVSVFNFGGIAGALIAAVLVDRYGPFRVLPFLFGMAAVSTAALEVLRPDLRLFLVATGVSGFAGYGAAVTLGPLALMLYPAPLRTSAVGWALGVGRLGGTLGPVGAGALLAAGLAPGRLFYFAATSAVLIAVCLVVFAHRRSPGLAIGRAVTEDRAS